MTVSGALYKIRHFVCLLIVLPLASSCTAPVVSDSALSFAKERVIAEVGAPPTKGSLIIVDYTKPSNKKRLSVVDLKSGRGKMNSRVAHGVNSGLLYATDFSDKVGSNKSSLGLYRLAEEYQGRHGTSFRLDGLDPGLNANARRRAIVVHAAEYATRAAMHENRKEFGRLGRSAGCLALSDKDLAKLDRKMERPVYIFAYAPTLAQQDYLPSDNAVPQTKPAPLSPTAMPQPMLASADKPAMSRPPAAPKPQLVSEDRLAIPRPATLGSRPASLGAQVASNLALSTAQH